MKQIFTLLLAGFLAFGLVGCKAGSLTPAQEKALIQTAFDTFVQAEAIYNPSFDTSKIKKDGDAAIAAWGVGATWQVNVVAELQVAMKDVADIPGCNTQCQAAVLVFQGGVNTVVIVLGGQPVASLPTYDSVADYRAAWNEVAPVVAQIN